MKSTDEAKVTAALILKNGEVFAAKGFGAQKITAGQIVVNNVIFGYQGVLTDPMYAGKIITFSFPHIGNAGINNQDGKDTKINAAGLILRNLPTESSNWRAEKEFPSWLLENNVTGLACIDTRRLGKKINEAKGGLYGIIAYDENGLDFPSLQKQAAEIQEPDSLS
ncbi:MAG: hypothetical protein IKD08_02665 [Alphaproteobacteria bacterium]|nr:hypothetical protein [Alphaproteobacteria bacterium]